MSQIFYENWWGDEQYTPRYWVEILLQHIQHLKDKIIWCPFDKEDSEFVITLKLNWFNVIYSHLEYWQDFLEYEPEYFDIIISNPPYKNKRLFWERCLSFWKPFALLLPLNILSDSMINNTLMQKNKDLQLLIPNKRMNFYNKVTWKSWNSPTFKATYFWVDIFEKQIILTEMNKY